MSRKGPDLEKITCKYWWLSNSGPIQKRHRCKFQAVSGEKACRQHLFMALRYQNQCLVCSCDREPFQFYCSQHLFHQNQTIEIN